MLRVCEGWSHLSCIDLKEGVGVMEGKEFVCYFCISACLLALQREVAGVKEKLCSAKFELKEVQEENRTLKDQRAKEKCEKLKVTQVKVVGGGGRGVTSRCEVVVGDRLKGTVRLEKGKIKQTVNNSH